MPRLLTKNVLVLRNEPPTTLAPSARAAIMGNGGLWSWEHEYPYVFVVIFALDVRNLNRKHICLHRLLAIRLYQKAPST